MRKLLALAATALLVACQPAPNGFVADPIRFAARGPVRMNVGEIRIRQNYQPPMRAPNVDHEFPVPPETALKTWVQDRLAAVGQSGLMEVTIEDASVKEVKLPKTEGVKGLFTDDQEARYDAVMHVTFRIYTGAQGMSDASGDVVVTRSRSINEKATVDERRKMFHDMTRDMMTQFNTEAEARLRQYFSRFMR
jgi:hypothetical protein